MVLNFYDNSLQQCSYHCLLFSFVHFVLANVLFFNAGQVVKKKQSEILKLLILFIRKYPDNFTLYSIQTVTKAKPTALENFCHIDNDLLYFISHFLSSQILWVQSRKYFGGFHPAKRIILQYSNDVTIKCYSLRFRSENNGDQIMNFWKTCLPITPPLFFGLFANNNHL